VTVAGTRMARLWSKLATVCKTSVGGEGGGDVGHGFIHAATGRPDRFGEFEYRAASVQDFKF